MTTESSNKEEVTVIMPVLNRASRVCASLESIKAQTYRPLHLVVVDNASTDDTHRVVVEWMQACDSEGFTTTLVTEPRRGASAARNRGLREAARGPVVFFDSDDCMRACLVERAVAAYRRGGNGCRIVYWRNRLTMLDGSVRTSHFPGDDVFGCQLIHSFINTSSFLADRDYITAAGGWDENLAVWNDYELALRLLLKVSGECRGRRTDWRAKLCGIDEVLHDMYAGEESITGTSFSRKEGEWEKSLKKAREDIGKSDYHDKESLYRMLDYRKAILAAHYRREGNKTAARRLLEEAEQGRGLLWQLRLRFSYLWTAAGLRGAWAIISVCGGAQSARRFLRMCLTKS